MAFSAIKAGAAYVEIFTKNGKLVAGLQDAVKRVGTFGQNVAKIGGGLSAVGTAIAAPMMVAAKQFAGVGDQLDKMRARSGFTAKSLSALGFAAEQGGASMDQLDKSLAAMARFSLQAEQGLSTATRALDMLGVSQADFQAADPEAKFMLLADALNEIEDPTLKAGLALQIFGRQGRELLPMLSGGADGIRELMAEAEKLGITLTEEDATAAAELTDAMNRVGRQFKAISTQIGAAIAGPLTEFMDFATRIVVTIIDWVKENRQLVQIVFAIGAALVAGGTALAAFGGAIAVAASIASTLIGVIGTIAGLLTSWPALLLAAAAGAVMLFEDTRNAVLGTLKEVWEGARDAFNRIVETFKTAYSGVAAAIDNGNWTDAMRIALLGLRIAAVDGLDALLGIFGSNIETLVGWFLDAFEQIIAGFRTVEDWWKKSQNWVADRLAAAAEDLGIVPEGTRATLKQDQAIANEQRQAERKRADLAWEKQREEIAKAFDTDALKAELETLVEQQKKEQAERRKERDAGKDKQVEERKLKAPQVAMAASGSLARSTTVGRAVSALGPRDVIGTLLREIRDEIKKGNKKKGVEDTGDIFDREAAERIGQEFGKQIDRRGV